MACELCESDGGELLWRDRQCRVVLIADTGYPGYCRAVWNAHVAEMTDLAAAKRAHFMRVVFAVEAGLRALLHPDKVNLASLGNLTPHLHWHVIPRFRNDPHFPNPIWGARLREASAAPAEVAALRQALAEHLSRL